MIMAVAAAVTWTAVSVPVYAQGCAMCYNDAAAAKSAAIQALRSGTLILLFPVLLMFAGILAMAFRSRNRFNESEPAWELVPAAGGEKPAALLKGQGYGRLPAMESEHLTGDWNSGRSGPQIQ
jgi:hypothetical protein